MNNTYRINDRGKKQIIKGIRIFKTVDIGLVHTIATSGEWKDANGKIRHYGPTWHRRKDSLNEPLKGSFGFILGWVHREHWFSLVVAGETK